MIRLLLRWTLIPVIVGFVEGIAYLRMSDEAFVEKLAGASAGAATVAAACVRPPPAASCTLPA